MSEKLYYCDACKVTGPIEIFEWYHGDPKRPLIHGLCINYAFEVGVGEVVFMPDVEKAKEVVKKIEKKQSPYETTFATQEDVYRTYYTGRWADSGED